MAKKKASAATSAGPKDRPFEVVEVEGFNVPLKKIPADDMPLTVMGETYYLQEGKFVYVIPVTSFGTMFSTAGLLLGAEEESAALMVRSMEGLYKRLADVVAKWDLVDTRGDELDQPYRNPEVFEAMNEDQLAWVLDCVTERESEEAKGKE